MSLIFIGGLCCTSYFFSLATGTSVGGYLYQSSTSPPPTGDSSPSTKEPPPPPSLPVAVSVPSSRKSKSHLKLALVCSAERILGVVYQQQREEDSWRPSESIEIQVCALLGLAQLSVVLHHSITGYQLGLQALRLFQSVEEGGGNLQGVDLYLWVECRYWVSRSLVGLECSPGGGGLLLEVGEHCEECGQLGEVEMVAQLELAAAEHAMTLLPCQLQAAQQHSQVHTCMYMHVHVRDMGSQVQWNPPNGGHIRTRHLILSFVERLSI